LIVPASDVTDRGGYGDVGRVARESVLVGLDVSRGMEMASLITGRLGRTMLLVA
jgi:hypothetical protein